MEIETLRIEVTSPRPQWARTPIGSELSPVAYPGTPYAAPTVPVEQLVHALPTPPHPSHLPDDISFGYGSE